MLVLFCLFYVTCLLRDTESYLLTQRADMKCKWTDPKGANCEPKMVKDLQIYKTKFGTEPSPKAIKPYRDNLPPIFHLIGISSENP